MVGNEILVGMTGKACWDCLSRLRAGANYEELIPVHLIKKAYDKSGVYPGPEGPFEVTTTIKKRRQAMKTLAWLAVFVIIVGCPAAYGVDSSEPLDPAFGGHAWMFPDPTEERVWQFQNPDVQRPWQFQDPNVQRPWQFQEPDVQLPWQFEDPGAQRPWLFDDPGTQRPWQFHDPGAERPWQFKDPTVPGQPWSFP